MKDKTMDELVQEAKDRASTEIFQRENGCIPQRRWSKEVEMAEAWSKAAAHNEWKEKAVEAARKWAKYRGGNNSEQYMESLIELFKQEPEKP
ncbi:hypothetical protein IM876_09230 [Serratia plymuthica]|uniref:hypothetical protein n=1 Tax=Serratia plymuthica TaxID=82996 RepID=UPI0019257C78|nr:hypothetical protein [Serratia plymuthica]MBL3522845.1 hypothetical protein [Serratia plymuthica]